ncbi:MAG: TniQ family protein [Actinomycetales bacterium]|nr:TniQ family protein [Actinomycetales bacterium]
MNAALPISVPPRPDQSVESWLEHLADANGLTTAQLLATIRRTGATTRYLTLAPSPETIATLAALARVNKKDVYAATPASFDGTALDLTGLDPGDRYSYRRVAARGWAPVHGTQICPACIAETGTWKTAWRLLIVTACIDTGLVLVAECSSCRQPFRDQRHSHLHRVGAATVCGNPLGQGPLNQCQHDLTTLAAASASPAVLTTQARIEAALTGKTVLVLGQEPEPAAYLADLRHLTTLLLHLAGQPGADGLAAWVSNLAPVAADRTSTRGPRWGIRPPDDPALRGQTPATADAILATDDLDTAATLLTPWTELTPTRNDGPLDWLADCAVMTATLTRLVMAARAPHRRLSHHLDTPRSDGARMPINLLLIPQVIPHEQYLELLTGASDSSEPTVRLFASLSLARLHSDITSWAAAEALGIPGPMGVRCARACSENMLVTAGEWEARIWRAGEESPRENYRAVEDKIRYRLGTNRWFDEWAHHNRPGTRHSSYGHGLTCQCLHVAHAHLDLSPAWRGSQPTAKDSARYRQFERSLDDNQQLELSHSLYHRPCAGSRPGGASEKKWAGRRQSMGAQPPHSLDSTHGLAPASARSRPMIPMAGLTCELINTTIPADDWELLQLVANGLPSWRKANVHALTRYGFSGARIYVLESPAGQREMPHVVKIAGVDDANEEVEGLGIAGKSIRNVKPFHTIALGPLTAIYFPLLEVADEKDGSFRVVDASDIYEDCLEGKRKASKAIVPMLRKTLKLMEGAHACPDPDQELTYAAVLTPYTRPKRASRAARLFAEGSLEIGGVRVHSNPTDALDQVLAMSSRGFVGRVNHGDFHLSNVVADGELLNPCLIDFAWTKAGGHGLVDFAMMESSLRFMRFPRDVNLHLLLDIDRKLSETLETSQVRNLVSKVRDRETRVKLDAMTASVTVVRSRMMEAYSSTSLDDLHLEYSRVLYAILCGQEKFHDFPILRTILNLHWLREKIGL